MGGSEMLFVVFVALLLFGGKQLPEIARTWGKTIRDMQRAWVEIKRQIGLDLMDDINSPPPPRKPPPPPPKAKEP